MFVICYYYVAVFYQMQKTIQKKQCDSGILCFVSLYVALLLLLSLYIRSRISH